MQLYNRVSGKGKMPNIAEILLKFKIVQLEGRLAIYESLVEDTAKLASMEKSISEVRDKLKQVAKAWDDCMLEDKNG